MLTTIQLDPALLARRRLALTQHATLTGIDFVKLIQVADDDNQTVTWYLAISFINKTTGRIIPSEITPNNIAIADSRQASSTALKISKLYKPDEVAAILNISQSANVILAKLPEGTDLEELGTASYTLTLINLADVDPFFNQVSFTVNPGESVEFDYQNQNQSLVNAQALDLPEINYLARDYQSFRQLMLDRLATLLPAWQPDHPADLPTVIVELLAHVADQLSYYQDAVATEAYLSTARQRISVKRHAKLLDYVIHEGCNARVWVHCELAQQLEPYQMTVPYPTRIFSQVNREDRSTNLPAEELIAAGAEVFVNLYPQTLYSEHNQIEFYTWGAGEATLPAGSVSATLLGNLQNLAVGDVLLLEEVVADQTDSTTVADPNRRHVIRLTSVDYQKDQLGGQLQADNTMGSVDVTNITWHAQDALLVDFILAGERTTTVARGNMLLADYGNIVTDELLQPTNEPGSSYLNLQQMNLTFAVPYDQAAARLLPAAQALEQKPHEAQPVIQLRQANSLWYNKPDLLNSNYLAQDFVVEIDNERQTIIRFGDGVLGKIPATDTVFTASYRFGNGTAGNIGAETLAYIENILEISRVYNPLPAQGGTEPETLEQVKFYAPHVAQRSGRAVTADDYVTFAKQHPEVVNAAATLRWTGSWYTLYLAIDRKNGLPVDATFRNQMLDYLEQYRLLGHDLQITAPTFVPLDIVLKVYIDTAYLPHAVQLMLLERFSYQYMSDGERGFFHPDNFSFGNNVYLSKMVTEIMQVPGVIAIDLQSAETRFRRRQDTSNHAFDDGFIEIGKLEIALLENNNNIPEHGLLKFIVEYYHD
jgi:hypothetical protein